MGWFMNTDADFKDVWRAILDFLHAVTPSTNHLGLGMFCVKILLVMLRL